MEVDANCRCAVSLNGCFSDDLIDWCAHFRLVSEKRHDRSEICVLPMEKRRKRTFSGELRTDAWARRNGSFFVFKLMFRDEFRQNPVPNTEFHFFRNISRGWSVRCAETERVTNCWCRLRLSFVTVDRTLITEKAPLSTPPASSTWRTATEDGGIND